MRFSFIWINWEDHFIIIVNKNATDGYHTWTAPPASSACSCWQRWHCRSSSRKASGQSSPNLLPSGFHQAAFPSIYFFHHLHPGLVSSKPSPTTRLLLPTYFHLPPRICSNCILETMSVLFGTWSEVVFPQATNVQARVVANMVMLFTSRGRTACLFEAPS